jgi:hypothetical protein
VKLRLVRPLIVLVFALLFRTDPAAAQSACTQNATTLCLSNGRFAVSATWRTTGGQNGQGQAVRISADTGYFTFFDAANVEAIVKVLDACGVNSRFWVFAGGLTDVNTVLTVRDTVTGTTRTYTNPQGTAFEPLQDTNAFATCHAAGNSLFASGGAPDFAESTPPPPAPVIALGACTPNATTMCLNDDRYAVTATWRTAAGQTGQAQAARLTGDTGYFTFFSTSNVEVVVKVLNACSVNSSYWVFAGGLTNVNVVLTVRDMVTGASKSYTNPQGSAFQPVQDSNALATCGGGTSFVSGTSTVVATQNVGAGGGTIRVTGSGTALDGAQIVFPTGALSGNASVKLSLNRGTILPISGGYSGAALAMEINGPSTFNQPVSITLPYGNGDVVPVPYFAGRRRSSPSIVRRARSRSRPFTHPCSRGSSDC